MGLFYTCVSLLLYLPSYCRNSLGYFGSLLDLTMEQKQELLKKAKSYWGDDVATWNDAQIIEVKNIIGLL